MTEIISHSPAMHNILSMVEKVAPTMATVLILGESGTGKELTARKLHHTSPRAEGPYVTVNCGALQESLLESELFGHEKGSFTGAVVQKTGLCEIAHGGTLFLDEIGEISLGIQAKLLRFLQEGEFYRIGGKNPIHVNVRIVSATNRNLAEEVKQGTFREDLFYRLNTITLKMPSLRHRKEDIPLLVEYFLTHSRYGAELPPKTIQAQAMEALCRYSWPGNIRELQNMIERLKILSEGDEIQLSDLPLHFHQTRSQHSHGLSFAHDVAHDVAYDVERQVGDAVLGGTVEEFPPNMPLNEVERYHILRALDFYGGNKTKTAQSLGITIKTLYNKLHRYGILQVQENV